jgi:hypothetical protein
MNAAEVHQEVERMRKRNPFVADPEQGSLVVSPDLQEAELAVIRMVITTCGNGNKLIEQRTIVG